MIAIIVSALLTAFAFFFAGTGPGFGVKSKTIWIVVFIGAVMMCLTIWLSMGYK